MTFEEIIQHGLDVAEAFERGRKKGFQQGWDRAIEYAATIDQDEMDANWEDGYATGFEEGVTEGSEEQKTKYIPDTLLAWENGYLAGNEDAYGDPELAMKTVIAIKQERAAVGGNAPTTH